MTKHVQEIDKETIEAVVAQSTTASKETELNLEQARANYAASQANADLEIDLEEIAPLPVAVGFIERIEEPVLDDEGKQVVIDGVAQTRLRAFTRRAVINTEVPVSLFTKVMSLKKKIDVLHNYNGKEEEVLDIYAQCVLDIWQLTEPAMTLKRLKAGLNFKQIRGLFARFFANLTA